jgi:peptidoglycan/LPS O-acetylase OafA/YrhL
MPNADRANNFDLIRLIAAIEVIYIHAQDHLGAPPLRGIEGLVDMIPGVPIFFVVSGFLVTRSFVRNDGRVGRFALNRALRIYPGLWANLLVITALIVATGSMTAAMIGPAFFKYQAGLFVFGSEIYGWLCSGFGYDFSPGHTFAHVPSGVLWTINVELGFYVLVPIVFCNPIRSRPRLQNAIIALAAAGSFVASALMTHAVKADPNAISTMLLVYGPLPYFWTFLLGAAISVNWARLHALFEDRVFVWLSGYFAIFVFGIYAFGGVTLDLARVRPFVVLEMLALGGTVISFAYSHRGLARILRGHDPSYGLYLYHMQIILILAALGFRGSAWLWPAIYAGAAIAAALSWFGIERPALRLKQRLRRAPITDADLSDNRWSRSSALPTAQK